MNTPFVLDASVTMAWCFETECSPETDALLRRALAHGVVVPSLWFVEMLNVVHGAVKRKRLKSTHAEAFIATLTRLPILVECVTDASGGFALCRVLSPLMAKYDLTSYDACYLETALRLHIPLATLDTKLVDAARSLEVPLALHCTPESS